MRAAELAGVEKHFGRVRALAGVSLEIQPGTLTLLSGPNGAGKSTLLRILAGLMRPTRGSVTVFESNLFGQAGAATRARLGFLGADAGLYGELSLRENLAFCARLHGVSEARIDAVVDELRLGGFLTRRLQTLSLGYRKRAGLARVLLTEPELLLLDEPWNGLDTRAGQRLADVLRGRHRRGLTAVVAAHSVGDHGALFDGEVVIQDGRLADAPGRAAT